MAIDGSDVLIGAAIGAAGGMQDIALPGLLLVGLGFDLAVSLIYAVNPSWFPHSGKLTVYDVFATAIGTTVGWGLVRTVVPQKIRTNPAARAAATASFFLLPAVGGRVPGRLRSYPRLR